MIDDADAISEGKPAMRSISLIGPPDYVGPSETGEQEPVTGSATDEASFLARLATSVRFDDAYSTARDWNLGEGLFLTWSSKVAGPLSHAYRLYLAFRLGGQGAMKIALQDQYFKK